MRSAAPSSAVVRSCVGCGERVTKSELLRLVVAGNEVVPDPRARLTGRGAYLHLSQRCFDRAVQRRVFLRALRAQGPLGTRLLAEYLSVSAAAAGSGRAD
ncbi:MAG TPA: YlxR family protein [Streptosporangiaceae bacterium]